VARVERQLEDLESPVPDKLRFAARIFRSSSKEQDGQCKCNVTLGRVRAIIDVVEKQRVLHVVSVCVCSLRYPA